MNFCGETVVRQCCSFKRVEKMKLLLEYGAEVNIADNKERTALYFVVMQNWFSNLEKMKVLLQYGAEMNIPSRYGNTLLHILADEQALRDEQEDCVIWRKEQR